MRFTVEDMLVENDKVAVGWTISGTHKGEFRGISPTGRKVSVEGITINHIADGKIMDSYVSWDALGLLQQQAQCVPADVGIHDLPVRNVIDRDSLQDRKS